jgi:hypothetical protein
MKPMPPFVQAVHMWNTPLAALRGSEACYCLAFAGCTFEGANLKDAVFEDALIGR